MIRSSFFRIEIMILIKFCYFVEATRTVCRISNCFCLADWICVFKIFPIGSRINSIAWMYVVLWHMLYVLHNIYSNMFARNKR